MNLVITTPTDVVLDRSDVDHVRAEDGSGAFGILPGHADLLTVLEIGVVSWREGSHHERYAAVRGGVLRVSGGDLVAIATREAVLGDDLLVLEENVVTQFRAEEERETTSRTAAARLELATIRRIREFIHPEERGAHRAATSVAAGNRHHEGAKP